MDAALLNYALIYRERALRQSPKTKDKEESNSKSVWVREELRKVIKYGRLNVNTAHETLSHFVFTDSYLSILFTSVRPSTWIMGRGKICPLKACFLLLMLVWFLFLVRRKYMTDDHELNVTQWVVSDRYALRALVLVQMSLLHSTIFPLAAYSP